MHKNKKKGKIYIENSDSVVYNYEMSEVTRMFLTKKGRNGFAALFSTENTLLRYNEKAIKWECMNVIQRYRDFVEI